MALKSKIQLPAHSPLNPPTLSSDLVYATKALVLGVADASQQTLFFNWLIVECCKKDDLSFRPGGPEGVRDTDLAEGKRFVALNVLRALNMPQEQIAAMKKAEDAAVGPDDEFPNR